MRLANYVLAVILALAIGAQLHAAPATGTLTLVNKSNLSPAIVYLVSYYVEDVVDTQTVVLAPNETWQNTVTIDTDTVTSVGVEVPIDTATLLGASLVYDSGASTLYRPLGNVQFAYSAPFPSVSYNVLSAVALPDGAKTLWLQDDATLNGNLFREGIDKVVNAVNENGGGASAAGSSGEKVELVATYQYGFITGASLPTDAAAQSNASVTAMQSAVTEHVVRQQGNVTATATGDGDASFWIVQLPKGNGEFRELDLNPMHVDGVPIIAQWVKIAISVLAIYLFEVWCWEQMQGIVGPAALIPQAKGNTVAGSGGQVTGLLNASAVATVMISLPALCFAVYSAAFTVIGALYPATSPVDVMPASGAEPFMTAAFTLINHFIPTTLLLIIAAQMFVVRKAAFAIYTSTGIIIKYLQF